MTENNAIHDKLCQSADLTLRIREWISSTDSDLAMIRQLLKKLSATLVIDHITLFEDHEFLKIWLI